MESNSVLKTNDIVKWDCQNVSAKQVCLKLWCQQLGTKEWCIWHHISHVAFITHFIILDKVILTRNSLKSHSFTSRVREKYIFLCERIKNIGHFGSLSTCF